MSVAELREKLHGYIDVADERHLEAIFVLVEKEMKSPYVLDDETIKELDRRKPNI